MTPEVANTPTASYLIDDEQHPGARIKVIGIGGEAVMAVNR